MFDDFDENEEFGDDLYNNADIEESLLKFKKLETDESVFFSEEEIEALSYHFFMHNKYKDQMTILEHGLYLYPNKVDFILEKASVYSMENNYSNALECVLLAKEHEPYNPVIHKMEGEILCDLDRASEAEACFRTALKYSENEDDELVIEIYINYAQMLAQNDRMEKANQLMEKALSTYQDNELLFNQLSMNFIANGQYEQAISYFKKHIDSNPYSHLGWYHLGRFYELTNKKDLAFNAYEYSGLANKESKNAFFNLGGILESRSSYKEAIENYLQCIQNSGDLYPYICIARCYLGLENGEMARRYLKKASGLEEILPEYHYLLGYSYLSDNQALKALPYFEKVYKEDKNDFAALKGILTCYSDLERIDELEAAYIKLKEDNHEMILENWKELGSVLYLTDADDLFSDLIEDIKTAGQFKEELEMVIDIIKYDQQPSDKNKDVIISGLIHNFEDTLESVKLYCHALYEEDTEFKKLIEIYQKEHNDE